MKSFWSFLWRRVFRSSLFCGHTMSSEVSEVPTFSPVPLLSLVLNLVLRPLPLVFALYYCSREIELFHSWIVFFFFHPCAVVLFQCTCEISCCSFKSTRVWMNTCMCRWWRRKMTNRRSEVLDRMHCMRATQHHTVITARSSSGAPRNSGSDQCGCVDSFADLRFVPKFAVQWEGGARVRSIVLLDTVFTPLFLRSRASACLLFV